MLRLSLFIAIFTLCVQSSFAQNLQRFFEATDIFYSTNVKGGKVNYKGIKENPKQINILLSYIQTAKTKDFTDLEKQAFYINAYNLIVIHTVSSYYPLKSPLDQSGFFDKLKHTVAGEKITLNELEFKKLLIPYGDPLFHFALVCAAKSCPKLWGKAYRPETLKNQLVVQAKAALDDPNFLKIDDKEKKVGFSQLFEWYAKDFQKAGFTKESFVNKYRSKPLPDGYASSFYTYDWSLNEL